MFLEYNHFSGTRFPFINRTLDLSYAVSKTDTLGTTSSDLLDPFRWGFLSRRNGPERPSIRAGYFRSVSISVQRDLWASGDASGARLPRPGASPDHLQTLWRWSLFFLENEFIISGYN